MGSLHSIDRLVLASVNASLPEHVSVDTLVAALRGRVQLASAWPALLALFSETPVDVVESFVAGHAIPLHEVLATYRALVALTQESAPDVEAWLGYLEAPPA